MSQNFIPSLLMPEIFYPIINEKNTTISILEKLIEKEFYHSFEITTGHKKKERDKILKLKEENNFLITQWLTFSIERHNYDISSPNKNLREKSIDFIKKSLDVGAETGTTNIALVPAKDPGKNLRGDYIKRFYEGICMICEEALKLNINILIEPLDRGVDKDRLIGPTHEAISFIKDVKKEYQNIGLAFDTAHAALNGEDVLKSINISKDELYQIHFSNAVLDKSHRLFGDLHIPIGKPGFLNTNKIVEILKEVSSINNKNKIIPIAIEARSNKSDDLFENEKMNRGILKNAINLIDN